MRSNKKNIVVIFLVSFVSIYIYIIDKGGESYI